jgi:hypothetical protein
VQWDHLGVGLVLLARSRALLASRVEAMHESGFKGSPADLRRNAQRVENRADVQARIAYLTRQDDAAFQAKRRKLEEFLWAAHDYNPGDLYEVVEKPVIARDGKPVLAADGKVVTEAVERPKMMRDLPPELRQVVEAKEFTKAGLMPKTYSNQGQCGTAQALGHWHGDRGRPGVGLRPHDRCRADRVADQAGQRAGHQDQSQLRAPGRVRVKCAI